MRKTKKKLIERKKEAGLIDEGWTVSTDGTLVCPCGRRVEDDGKCPNGHKSPLRQLGFI